ADEGEGGAHHAHRDVLRGADHHAPVGAHAAQVHDLGAGGDGGAGAGGEVEHLPGQRAEVDVGAVGGAGGGDRLGDRSTLGDQRCPLGELGVLGGELHPVEQRVRGEGLMAPTQVVDVLHHVHAAHVREGMVVRGRVADAIYLIL